MSAAMDGRRVRRVQATLPVELMAASSDVQAVRIVGEVRNISPDGVYLRTREASDLQAGETVRLVVYVPEGLRRSVPFSRMSGLGRVLRVERGSGSGEGMAIYFYPDRFSMLGTVYA